jgi:hypothetical protein
VVAALTYDLKAFAALPTGDAATCCCAKQAAVVRSTTDNGATARHVIVTCFVPILTTKPISVRD